MPQCAKSLRGLWVITSAEGIKIGGVHEVYFNVEEKKLSGFGIKARAFLQDETLWLPLSNMKKIGEDVIFVSKEDAALKEKEEGKSLNQLIGMPVDTKDGRNLGKLTEVVISKTTGQIKSLCLDSRQSVDIEFEELVLGDDLILVQSNATLHPFEQKEKNENHLVADISDVVSRYSSSAVKQGEELAHRAAELIKSTIRRDSESEQSGETSDTEEISAEKRN